MTMSEHRLRKYISTSFKLHGFTLRSDSCTFLVEQFSPLLEDEHDKWIEKLIDHIQNQRLPSAVIEKNAVELAVKDCANKHHEVADDIFSVINAFDIPKFEYNLDLKKYEPAEITVSNCPKIFDTAVAKAEIFRNRFIKLKQVTERHELFRPTTTGDGDGKYKIYPIEYLLSCGRKLTNIISMGLLSQLKIGCYHLEDPTGIVQLDLSETISFSIQIFILSETMKKLQRLFQGYNNFPPIAFIFMGAFLSTKYGSTRIGQLKLQFKALGDMLAPFTNLMRESRFIFVPGPTDPACANVLPRPALPQYIWDEFAQKVPGAVFTSNPCHIRYCTQEIVVLREDVMSKLSRNTLHYPGTGDIYAHFAKTLLCQAHLTPLPLSVRPVYWGFEHALHLYPAPDLVVVGDSLASFSSHHADTQFVNPVRITRTFFQE
ncbi:hypothetical protein B566_EDAN006249 [Ephemera danica]|nr:hypothetical protein B566_EDAN006249 [Ephemera danica]